MSTVEYGNALYYPYIHLRDSNWIKVAALYYDKISRIVPGDFNPSDQNIVNVLQDKLDLFEFVNPQDTAEKLAPGFIDFARKNLSSAKKREIILSKLQRAIPQESWFRIHPGKMTRSLSKTLRDLKLAKESPSDPSGDFDLEPITGALYMTFLAKRIADDRSLPIVTDDPVYQPLIYQPTRLEMKSNIPEAKRDKGFALASLVIETAIPQNIQDVPIESIVKFRKNHESERQNFFNGITTLAKELEKIEDQRAIEGVLAKNRAKVEQSVKSLESAMRSSNITCTATLFSLSIPAWIKIAGIASLGISQPILAGGALLMAASLSLAKWHTDIKKAKNDNLYSYVLSLKRDLNVNSFMRQLLRGNILI